MTNVSRLRDIVRLYETLGGVATPLGSVRCLKDCHGRMPWPSRGVFFFFEKGEARSTSGSGPRVVRVGTHALTSESQRSLWDRLRQHRGTANTGGGNHRSSVFRLLVGDALIRRDGLGCRHVGSGRKCQRGSTHAQSRR